MTDWRSLPTHVWNAIMETIIQRSTSMFALLFQIQKPCQHLGRVFGCHFWIKLSSIPLTNVWAGKQHELIPKNVKIRLTNECFDWVAFFLFVWRSGFDTGFPSHGTWENSDSHDQSKIREWTISWETPSQIVILQTFLCCFMLWKSFKLPWPCCRLAT